MRDKRLHVITGRTCNNNCMFCIDEKGERPDLSVSDAYRQLEDNKSLKKVVFTCGEPTLHSNLVELVEEAQRLGYREILLVTNARRLSYPEYAKALVEAGLTAVMVSIHGPDAKIHDRLTRTPGSFKQTLAGLENMLSLKSSTGRPKVFTSTVVQKGNVDHLQKLMNMLARLEPDESVLNVVQPLGQAALNFGHVVVRYTLAARIISKVLDLISGLTIKVEGLPYCVMKKNLDSHGYREAIVMRKQGLDLDLEPNRDQVLGPPCLECSLSEYCGGVFHAYVEKFGWDEFHPVLHGHRYGGDE